MREIHTQFSATRPTLGGTGKLARPCIPRSAFCILHSAFFRHSSLVISNSPRRRRGFTLIELITVVAIIGILLAIALPGASRMWSQRNEAGAANMVRGLLESARSQAIRTGERGLFFYADAEGHQHVVIIAADPPGRGPTDRDVLNCQANGQPDDCVSPVEALDRFRVVPGKVYTLPAPYRAAPLWALDEDKKTSPAIWTGWPQQLANKRFPTNTSGADTPRYHRNVFTVIFNVRGEMVVDRDVFIHDYDPDVGTPDADDDNVGDVTELPVYDVTDAWYQPAGSKPKSVKLKTTSDDKRAELYDIVGLDDGRAANFKSVAGLVVYDESSMEGLTAVEMRDTFIDQGQPLYVSRYTGDVVFGPKGL